MQENPPVPLDPAESSMDELCPGKLVDYMGANMGGDAI